MHVKMMDLSNYGDYIYIHELPWKIFLSSTFFWYDISRVATPFWGKCEVATHTPENGTWESFGIPENLEFNCKGQNTSP
jgi:hypothetical protein